MASLRWGYGKLNWNCGLWSLFWPSCQFCHLARFYPLISLKDTQRDRVQWYRISVPRVMWEKSMTIICCSVAYLMWVSLPNPVEEWIQEEPWRRSVRKVQSGWRSSTGCDVCKIVGIKQHYYWSGRAWKKISINLLPISSLLTWCGWWRWCQHRALGNIHKSHCSSFQELLKGKVIYFALSQQKRRGGRGKNNVLKDEVKYNNLRPCSVNMSRLRPSLFPISRNS